MELHIVSSGTETKGDEYLIISGINTCIFFYVYISFVAILHHQKKIIMAIKKKATQKKIVAKKTGNAKTKAQNLSGLQIAMKQALKDPKLWITESAGISIDHFIPKKTASKLVKNFNHRKTPIAKGAFMQPSNIKKQIFIDLLNRPEVVSLRFYFGLTEDNKVQVIFVGADANHNDVYVIRPEAGNDMPAKSQAKSAAVNSTQATTTGGEEGGIDMSQGCPAYGSGGTVMLPA